MEDDDQLSTGEWEYSDVDVDQASHDSDSVEEEEEQTFKLFIGQVRPPVACRCVL